LKDMDKCVYRHFRDKPTKFIWRLVSLWQSNGQFYEQ